MFWLQVEASDADSEENARLTYSILDSHDGRHFTIEETTGAIFSGLKFDREETSTYTFVARATDSGVNPKSADVKVMVTIDDHNDVSPKFTHVR